MFRSSTILRELVQSLAKVIIRQNLQYNYVVVYCVEMWQHVVKRRVCSLFCRLTLDQSAQQRAQTPFQDMLPHLHTLYNDISLLNVLTEI